MEKADANKPEIMILRLPNVSEAGPKIVGKLHKKMQKGCLRRQYNFHLL
ncbi:hypothetical protein [Sporosarcina globispora]|nr:hypothetical protein [Sporosarcina globispora]